MRHLILLLLLSTTAIADVPDRCTDEALTTTISDPAELLFVCLNERRQYCSAFEACANQDSNTNILNAQLLDEREKLVTERDTLRGRIQTCNRKLRKTRK